VKILPALTALAKLEASSARLYEYYGEVLAGNPEASTLFLVMAQDEHSHLRVIEYQRRLLRGNLELLQDVDLDMETVERAIARIRGAIGPSTPPTLDEAIGFALRVETGALQSYYRTALAEVTPAMNAVLENLARNERAHLNRLMEFAKARTFGEPDPPPAPQPPTITR
jgi:rubrerythrin